jgi:hypothetical protein
MAEVRRSGQPERAPRLEAPLRLEREPPEALERLLAPLPALEQPAPQQQRWLSLELQRNPQQRALRRPERQAREIAEVSYALGLSSRELPRRMRRRAL